jgi:hypothetical protein
MDGQGRRGFDSMKWFWVMLGGLVTLEKAQAPQYGADAKHPPA